MIRRFQFASGAAIPRWCVWLILALVFINLINSIAS